MRSIYHRTTTPSLRVPQPLFLRPAFSNVSLRNTSTVPGTDDPQSPREQLLALHELVQHARTSNSPFHKIETIQAYPQLRPLLEIIHDPTVKFNVTSSKLKNYLIAPPLLSMPKIAKSVVVPHTLVELLEQLAGRTITGNKAKETVRQFLDKHGIGEDEPELWGTFMNVIDRGLNAGFGASVLGRVPWEGDVGDVGEGSVGRGPSMPASVREKASSQQTSTSSSPPASDSASTASELAAGSSTNRNMTRFSCALGKSIDSGLGDLMESTKDRWYASRKLDGVRVLALLDFYVPNDKSAVVTFESASFRSRSGNEFTSLAKLEEQLQHLAQYPGLRDLLEYDVEVVENRPEGSIKRLVLDGEVCHMVPSQGKDVRVGDDGTGASALWENDGLVEDFHQAVSMVKRRQTMDRPLYFVFDVLSWGEVASGKGTRLFHERVGVMGELVGWLRDELQRRDNGTEPRVRGLVQREVGGRGDAEAMVKRAMDEGWEGLIFRMDRPYKGKRSGEILKYKKFSDAEYKVLGVETNKMRLGINGVYDEYEALSNVWIEHKGHKVSVGSGFSAEERVRYGADPSAIIGRMMTVEYFSESQAVSRDSGLSLRFPRVKKIWEGERDV